MKIATWNVNSGAVSDRLAELRTAYEVDIVAMQETAEPTDAISTCLWAGDMTHKGVSLSSTEPLERFVMKGDTSPCIAATIDNSPLGSFNILSLWAKPTPSYYADISRTLDLYSTFIRKRPTVILGDFNMSARLHDVGRKFYLLNARLNHDFGVFSAYHDYTNERFGMESMTTLYHQWGAAGCFHCDFIYIPASWIPQLRSVVIPGYVKFNTSDHRPVMCEFG
ncbi:MAG: endonuclease/exonuclease/phosphatase family protein [Cyanobacteria bacterium J06648_10]